MSRLRHLYGFMAPREFVACRDELLANGFTGRQIDGWVRGGRLIRILRATYSYGREPETRKAMRRAALLVAGPGSFLTGRSACEAWGMVEPRPGLPRTLEVGSPLGQARIFKGCSPGLRETTVKVSRRMFVAGEIRTREGLALARPALALVDFAAEASDQEVRFAFLNACLAGLLNREDLSYCFERLTHRRGIRTLRPYLQLWRPELQQTRSVFEGWYLLVWAERRHLPMPKVNARLLGYEVDLYWPAHGFVLELDGESYHRGEIQRQIDEAKRRDLESRGLRVERLAFRRFQADPVGEVDAIAARLGLLASK